MLLKETMYNEMYNLLVLHHIITGTGNISPNLHKLLEKSQHLVRTIMEMTPFIDGDFQSTYNKRMYCIKNKLTVHPECVVCGNNTNYQISSRSFSITCSRQCASANPTRLDKKRSTSLAKYGTINPLSNQQIKIKSQKTSMEKYGTERPCQSELIKDKIRSTFGKKYGGHPMQNTFMQQQTKLNNQVKYGTDHPQQVHHIYKKTRRGCLLKHNVMYPQQIHIPTETLTKFNNRDWLYNQHCVLKKSVQQICMENQITAPFVLARFLKHQITRQYFFESVPERQIAEWLDSQGVQYRTSVRDAIRPLELDIVIQHAGKTIAIEYCGLYWHSQSPRINPNYHLNKLKKCQAANIRLITIFEDEWEHNKELVLNKLSHILGLYTGPKVYARKTTCVLVTSADKKQFLDSYHIQGTGRGSLSYGLISNGELVACVTLVVNSDHLLLNRYATKHPVVGGFTKLLAHVRKEYPTQKIVSFADLRWSEGNMYKLAGFKMVKQLVPDYRYVVGNNRVHKFNFRHDNGLKNLQNYDPKLSETQNMCNHKIGRIWDCGLLKYEI